MRTGDNVLPKHERFEEAESIARAIALQRNVGRKLISTHKSLLERIDVHYRLQDWKVTWHFYNPLSNRVENSIPPLNKHVLVA